MMRVVGKASVVAIALSLVVTGSAMAAGQFHSFSPSAIPTDAGGISPRDFLGTGFEQSEGFNVGDTMNPIEMGWKCRLPANNPPLCGGEVAPKGNGSAQSFQVHQNFAYPVGTLAGVRTPTITSVQLNTLNWDFRMDDNGGATYFMLPQAPSQGFVTAYFGYQWTGYIYAVAYTDAGHSNFAAIPLGFWDTNWNTYQMKLSNPGAADTTLTFYAGPDKDHLTQLCDITDGQCDFYPAGTQFEEALLVSDNAQNTGAGSYDGAAPSGYFDNIVLKPEPGTLAMLGAGLVLALRRRTAR